MARIKRQLNKPKPGRNLTSLQGDGHDPPTQIDDSDGSAASTQADGHDSPAQPNRQKVAGYETLPAFRLPYHIDDFGSAHERNPRSTVIYIGDLQFDAETGLERQLDPTAWEQQNGQAPGDIIACALGQGGTTLRKNWTAEEIHEAVRRYMADGGTQRCLVQKPQVEKRQVPEAERAGEPQTKHRRRRNSMELLLAANAANGCELFGGRRRLAHKAPSEEIRDEVLGALTAPTHDHPLMLAQRRLTDYNQDIYSSRYLETRKWIPRGNKLFRAPIGPSTQMWEGKKFYDFELLTQRSVQSGVSEVDGRLWSRHDPDRDINLNAQYALPRDQWPRELKQRSIDDSFGYRRWVKGWPVMPKGGLAPEHAKLWERMWQPPLAGDAYLQYNQRGDLRN